MTSKDRTGNDRTGLAESDGFFELSLDILAIIDKGGRLRRVNPAFTTVLGHGPEALPGRPARDFIHPDDHAATAAEMAAAHPARQSAGIESRWRHADGSHRWIQWHWFPWRTTGADGLICGVGRDVTDHRRREEQIRQRERQFTAAQRMAQIGDWRLEIESGQVTWSAEMYRLFGVDRNAFRPAFDTIIAMVHPDDQGKVAFALDRAVTRMSSADFEYRIIRPDGVERVLWTDAHCEVDAMGTVAALFGVSQDITSRKHGEAALIQARDAAEMANRAKSQFLASMSHELRTPLNAIIGFSEIMAAELMGPVVNERYLGYCQNILDSGRHLLDLINDILDLAKIEAGRFELTDELLDPADSVADAVRLVEPASAAKGTALAVAFPPDLPALNADRRALRQMLLNLLSNAVKFTPNGGRIEVTAIIESDGLRLTVADTGIGIPAERLDGLAKPFVQAENVLTRRQDGSGIGLYITKSLIERHDGHLDIFSQVGVGTTVSLLFPADRLVELA